MIKLQFNAVILRKVKNLNGTMFLGVLALMDTTRENIKLQKKGWNESPPSMRQHPMRKITFQDVIVTFALYTSIRFMLRAFAQCRDI